MSRFKQLESFVAVATQGSLSAAARQEGVAPAMIGRRINALEARLGIKLLVRSTRSMSLTSEGSAFLEEAQRILRELNDLEPRVSREACALPVTCASARRQGSGAGISRHC